MFVLGSFHGITRLFKNDLQWHVILITTSQKPSGKLEEEIYEALAADAHVVERPDHFLTEAEEKSLEELNAEEVSSELPLLPLFIMYNVQCTIYNLIVHSSVQSIHVNFR